MVINRVKDRKCTEKLMELTDGDITLNNVIRICRQVELTRSHLDNLDEEKTFNTTIPKVSGNPSLSVLNVWRRHDSTWCRADSAT